MSIKSNVNLPTAVASPAAAGSNIASPHTSSWHLTFGSSVVSVFEVWKNRLDAQTSNSASAMRTCRNPAIPTRSIHSAFVSDGLPSAIARVSKPTRLLNETCVRCGSSASCSRVVDAYGPRPAHPAMSKPVSPISPTSTCSFFSRSATRPPSSTHQSPVASSHSSSLGSARIYAMNSSLSMAPERSRSAASKTSLASFLREREIRRSVAMIMARYQTERVVCEKGSQKETQKTPTQS